MPENTRAAARTDRPTTPNRRAIRPAFIDPNQLYSVAEAAAALDRSIAGFYADLESGLVRSCGDGRRRKVIGAEIIRRAREIAGVDGEAEADAEPA